MSAQKESQRNPKFVTVLTVLGKKQRFPKERIVIGSVDSADLRLVSMVSPVHAVIESSASAGNRPEAVIYDLKSDSGVFVNGTRVVTAKLNAGDRLSIGQYEITYGFEEAPTETSKNPILAWNEAFAAGSGEEERRALLLEDPSRVVEIFDYRPASEQALEVVKSWCGTILDVTHYRAEKQVRLGVNPGAEIAVPALLSHPLFPLATRNGESWSLSIDSKMSGVLQGKGTLRSVEQIREQSAQGEFGATVPFGAADFAKLSVGDLDFYVRFTPAPPRLKKRSSGVADALFWKSIFGSLAFTAAFVLLFISMRPAQQIEPEELPPRLATILYQPEKYVQKQPKLTGREAPVEEKQVPNPPKPKEKKANVKLSNTPEKASQNKAAKVAQKAQQKRQEGQSEAKEGEGARAKGKEGSRGNRNSRNQGEKQTAASRPSPQGGEGRGGSRSQLENQGNLDLIKGAGDKILNLLGSSSNQLGKGGKKLEGFGGFSTQGNGGLALSGSGSGGGGTADNLGGLGTKGQGGGRVGTGLGAAGAGSGIIGGRSRVEVRTGGPEETVIMGSIDKEAVEAAIRERKDEFQLCYDRELNGGQPRLAGQVIPTFIIGSEGRVIQGGIKSSSIHNANVEQCVLVVLRRIQFPIPNGVNSVTVTYPFKYSPTGN